MRVGSIAFSCHKIILYQAVQVIVGLDAQPIPTRQSIPVRGGHVRLGNQIIPNYSDPCYLILRNRDVLG